MQVEKNIVHPEFDAATGANDIAILELETPVVFSDAVGPICLPDGEEESYFENQATQS